MPDQSSCEAMPKAHDARAATSIGLQSHLCANLGFSSRNCNRTGRHGMHWQLFPRLLHLPISRENHSPVNANDQLKGLSSDLGPGPKDNSTAHTKTLRVLRLYPGAFRGAIHERHRTSHQTKRGLVPSLALPGDGTHAIVGRPRRRYGCALQLQNLLHGHSGKGVLREEGGMGIATHARLRNGMSICSTLLWARAM